MWKTLVENLHKSCRCECFNILVIVVITFICHLLCNSGKLLQNAIVLKLNLQLPKDGKSSLAV
jgi:hypothetical protein